jgi:probable rRNA maturation factor
MSTAKKVKTKKITPEVKVAIRTQAGLKQKLAPTRVRLAIRRVVKELGYLPDCSITVMLADDTLLADLNRRFRKIARPTDVLSFPAGDMDPETGVIHLGEIVLSLPRTAAQARTAGHSFEQEALLLVVHGTLHLFGYDHNTAARRKNMWAEQDRILASLPPSSRPATKK